MSTLLSTPSVGCYSTSNLRGRRFSFNPPRPNDIFAHLRDTASLHSVPLGGPVMVDDDSSDDSYHKKTGIDEVPRFNSTDLPSPLSDAHVTDYMTVVSPPRYGERLNYNACSMPLPTSGGCIVDVGTLGAPPQLTAENLKVRLACTYFLYFLFGWGDGLTGAVLPYIQAQFHITPSISSLLFSGSTIGFFLGTFVVERVRISLGSSRILRSLFVTKMPEGYNRGYSPSQGRYATLLAFSFVHATFFIIMGLRLHFGLAMLAYVLAAFARAFMTASQNEYLANNYKSGLAYAFGIWSFGGVCSPLVCQSLIAAGYPWSNFYFGSLVLSFINTCFILYAFRPSLREQVNEMEDSLNSTLYHAAPSSSSFDEKTGNTSSETCSTPQSHKSTFRLVITLPFQWAFSCFMFLYTGSETTTQGLIVTYLLALKHANPNTVGYVTSGFWGGISLGRFVWGTYVSRLTFTQKKFLMQGCLSIALTMQFMIWFINSNLENSFSAAIIGLMYGPVWPAAMECANEILPAHVHMASMALLSAFGSLGASIFPFITGTVFSVKGPGTYTYFTVAGTSILFLLWFLFPSRVSRPPQN